MYKWNFSEFKISQFGTIFQTEFRGLHHADIAFAQAKWCQTDSDWAFEVGDEKFYVDWHFILLY